MTSYANPQNLNRFSYALNNPILYNDPSGHKACEGTDNACKGWENVPSTPALAHQIIRRHGVTLSGNWIYKDVMAVAFAVADIGAQFASQRHQNESSADAFQAVYDHVALIWKGSPGKCGNDYVSSGGCTDGPNQVRFWSLSGQLDTDLVRMVKNVVHEFGHVYNDGHHYGPSTNLDNGTLRFNRPLFLRPNMADGEISPNHYDWQQHPPEMDADGWSGGETFADMFVAWTYNAWNTNSATENVNAVSEAQAFMNNYLP